MVDAVNEDEQLDRLKEWWQENWLPLVLGLGLAIAGVLGWNLWQSYQKEQAELASGHFEQLRLAMQLGDIGLASEQAETLKSGYRSTAYAAQGALLVARGLVDKQDLAGAASQLEWVTNYADDIKLQHVGRLRLARIRWAQGEPEAAVALLKAPKLDSFAGVYAELRGDILVTMGRDEEARESYKQAMQVADVSDLATLQQKAADLVDDVADSTAAEDDEEAIGNE